MKAKLRYGTGNTVPYTLVEYDEYESGDLLFYGGAMRVVQGLNIEAEEGDTVAVVDGGIFEVACEAATEFADGAAVYANFTTNLAVTSGDDDAYIGTAVGAVDDAGTTVLVDLNRVPLDTST